MSLYSYGMKKTRFYSGYGLLFFQYFSVFYTLLTMTLQKEEDSNDKIKFFLVIIQNVLKSYLKLNRNRHFRITIVLVRKT